MKVLHVHSGNLFGGIERTLVTLARQQHLCPQMQHHYALSFEAQLTSELRALSASVGILGSVRIRNPWAIRQARHQLKRLIASSKPDVIVSHAPWTQAAFGVTIRASTLPFVFWLHDAVEGLDRVQRLAKLSRPDIAICNSLFTATKLPNLYPDCQNEVVYSPVDTEARDVTMQPRASIRAQFGAQPDSVIIVMTSRLEPWKGHELLLAALSKLNSSDKWECWIAGGVQRKEEQAYLQSLQQTVNHYKLTNRIKFVGHIFDVASVLFASDIHCQPNLDPEPFGIAFVEALACGLPVVTTRLGSAPAIVDESCGTLVNPNDSSALAAALTRLVNDAALRQQFSAAAPARARALCDPGRQIGKLYNFFERAANQSKGQASSVAVA